MIVSAIAAISRFGCIGRDNDMPWNVPADMRYFMQTTKGHHVITGRKNYEAMGKLPRRTNIIVTRQKNYTAKDCIVVHSIEAGIELARFNGESEAFVIGGGQIYQMVFDKKLIDKLYLTKLDLEVENCEVFFPKVDPAQWTEISRREGVIDEKNTVAQTYLVFERNDLMLQ